MRRCELVALIALAAAYTAPPALESGLLAVGGQTDESPLSHEPAKLAKGPRKASDIAPDACPNFNCGKNGNCCGDGGAWAGQCPDKHSWEEGLAACVTYRKEKEADEEKKAALKKATENAKKVAAKDSCPKCGDDGNCCGPNGAWADTCVSHPIFPDDRSWDDGHDACKGHRALDRAVAAEKQAYAPKHPPPKRDSCPKCGLGDNCCGEHGAWAGQCPRERSWDDGYKACEAYRQSVKERSCPICGEDFNCCNEGGSWHGSCPMLHTYDEGYVSCTAKRDAYWDNEATKVDKDGKYRMTHWASQIALNHLFNVGKPSKDLEEVGLIVHCFDDTEKVSEPWAPCDDGWCNESGQWWSGSIINSNLRGAFGDAGIIIAPNQVSLLCSFDADSGTIFSGCENGGTGNDGFFGPNATDQMMLSHMEGGAVGYNEVIINSAQFRANMPKSIAGIVYGLKVGNAAVESGLRTSFDKVRAVHTYVTFLDRYNLTEQEIPLLRANFDTEDVTGVNGQHGVALVDESEGAREYLANHPYAPALEKWQKSHPYLRDHPERTHQWMRRRNEVEIGHALRGGVPASVQAPADEQGDRGGSTESGGSSS